LQATTLLMAEPALNPVWTWLVHAETPGAWALAGGVVIVSSTLWNIHGRAESDTQPTASKRLATR
jgi:drug/metabolite transporter (DMT)-like permease